MDGLRGCKCETVKYYPDKEGWFCMLCFEKFLPAVILGATKTTHQVPMETGVWVFQPHVEGHGTG